MFAELIGYFFLLKEPQVFHHGTPLLGSTSQNLGTSGDMLGNIGF